MGYFWKSNPAFKILIPFSLGIIFSILLRVEHHWFGVLAVFFFLLFNGVGWFKSFRLRYIKGIVLSILLFFLGAELVVIKTARLDMHHYSHYVSDAAYLEVRITDNLEEKEKSFKTEAEVLFICSKKKKFTPVKGKLLLYFKKDSSLHRVGYGNILWIKAKINTIEPPSNPAQFDYQNYLYLNGIYDQAYLTPKDWFLTNKHQGNPIVAFANKARNYCYEALKRNGVVGKQLDVASALLLGYREKLDKDLVQSYASAGAMHVLAVSGLHVGILFFLLKFSFGFLKKIKKLKWTYAIFILACLWFYAVITGFSASVLRATTMFSFVLIGEEFVRKKVSIYNTLAVSAIVLLVVNPFILFEVGFQLSYLAVIGIVYLQPKIYALFYTSHWIVDQAWKITAVSIAAQIATFPLGLYYFHQFPVYFFISNLIVIPVATGIIYIGVIVLVLSFFTAYSTYVGYVLNGLIVFLNQSVTTTENIPFSLVEEISISIAEMYVLYFTIVLFLITLYFKRIRYMYWTFVLLFIFIGLKSYDRWLNYTTKELLVYSVNNTTAIELSKANASYMITDSALWNNESQLLFTIKHYWYKREITNKTFLPANQFNYKDATLYLKNGVILFEGKTFVRLHPTNLDVLEKLKPALVLVDKHNIKLLKQVSKSKLTSAIIVMDSSIKPYQVDYWKKQLQQFKVVSTAKKYFRYSIK